MMLLDNVKTFGAKALEFGAKNSPTILAGVACAGAVVTGVAAFRAGLKAKDILDSHKSKIDAIRSTEELSEEEQKEEEKQATIDTAKELAPIVLPVVAIAGATAACALGSNNINLRRQAVLTAAFELTQANCLEQQNYIEKAKELIGVDKDKEIQKEVVEAEKAGNSTKYVSVNEEDIWCRDLVYGSKFKSNRSKIREAFLDIKEELLDTESFKSVNDLYDRLGLPEFGKGEKEGWNPGDSIYVNFGSEYDDGELVLTFNYKTYRDADWRCLAM